jgi:hypothetical protein
MKNDTKSKWHHVRVDEETHKELQRLSKVKKIKKPMAQIIRERVFQGEIKTSNVLVIRQLLESNNATRLSLSRVAANINQLARIYNSQKEDDKKIIERDRQLRAELLAMLKEQLGHSKEIHSLCLEIMGRKARE